MATQGSGATGTLVLPTYGRVAAKVGGVTWNEQESQGGYCTVDIEFVQGRRRAAAPRAASDTASALIAGIASLQTIIENAYARVMAPLGGAGAGAERGSRIDGAGAERDGAR